MVLESQFCPMRCPLQSQVSLLYMLVNIFLYFWFNSQNQKTHHLVFKRLYGVTQTKLFYRGGSGLVERT